MVLNYKGRHVIGNRTNTIIYSTEQVRSPYTEHVVSGLPNPTHLEREVRFIQDLYCL